MVSPVKGGQEKKVIPGVYVPPPEGFLNISQLIDFLKCNYRWDLGYNRGISSRIGVRAVDVGSAVHAGIAEVLKMHSTTKRFTKAMLKDYIGTGAEVAAAYIIAAGKSRGGPERMYDDERADYEDALSSSPQVLERAVTRMRLDRLRVHKMGKEPLIERTFQSPIDPSTGWKGFHFTIDLCVEDLELGGLWLWDYKIRKQFTQTEDEEVNLQFPAYQKGLAHHGIITVGSMMFQVSSKPEGVPKLNKDGTMSKADIHCSWDSYRAALEAAGLDPKQYKDMQVKLKDKRFVSEERVPRSMPEVEWIWKDIITRWARRMTDARVQGPDLRSMHMMGCKGCWARKFCIAELKGEDTEFLTETDYFDKNNPKERLILKPEDVVFEE